MNKKVLIIIILLLIFCCIVLSFLFSKKPVIFEISPKNASVIIDKDIINQKTLKLSPGMHSVVVYATGYIHAQQDIRVSYWGSNKVIITLEKLKDISELLPYYELVGDNFFDIEQTTNEYLEPVYNVRLFGTNENDAIKWFKKVGLDTKKANIVFTVDGD